MTDISKSPTNSNTEATPQCQYFVLRKKRLCRMTVRPGRQYCGEHEPEPKTEEGQNDTRIPCPYDSKHTCYASKLEKHLSICNAKQTELPPYIIPNINAPDEVTPCVRRPLSEIPREIVMQVIDKVNQLYEKHIEGNIRQIPDRPIHPAVMEEFSEGDRTESSRRHMRQASSLLHLAEEAGLVHDQTCYVELGAGKGQLSYYMSTAWCDALTGSSVVVVDRAALRHKRDNKVRARATRLRADLAHLALAPALAGAPPVVGVAKHLCGVATDYALRCVTGAGANAGAGAGAGVRARGVVLAACCHHRCERAGYVANKQLQDLGISGDDLNTMLGIVSWATCGDGRSRDRRRLLAVAEATSADERSDNTTGLDPAGTDATSQDSRVTSPKEATKKGSRFTDPKWREEEATRNSKVIDLKLREQEATRNNSGFTDLKRREEEATSKDNGFTDPKEATKDSGFTDPKEATINDSGFTDPKRREEATRKDSKFNDPKWREEVGRRAKAVLDWGRVLFLRQRGFDAGLCHYVPASVSPENVCILATRPALS